jgi:hypothetical protein
MKITVYDILGYLASGMSQEEILADFSTWRRRTSAPAWLSPPTSSTGSWQSNIFEAALRPKRLFAACIFLY